MSNNDERQVGDYIKEIRNAENYTFISEIMIIQILGNGAMEDQHDNTYYSKGGNYVVFSIQRLPDLILARS